MVDEDVVLLGETRMNFGVRKDDVPKRKEDRECGDLRNRIIEFLHVLSGHLHCNPSHVKVSECPITSNQTFQLDG